MFRSLWIHKLLGMNSRSNRRRQAAQSRRSIRPMLEKLEDRVNPASFLPTAATAAQLQADVSFADTHTSQAWSIKLAANTTFNLTATQTIVAGASVSIVGQGGDTITPQAGATGFKANAAAAGAPGGVLNLSNLTISGGKLIESGGVGGAALQDAGTVSLNAVTVSGNTTYAAGAGAVEGGAIYVLAGGKLTIQSSTITANTASGYEVDGITSTTATAEGGGIYDAGGKVNITGSTLSDNIVQSANQATATAGEARGGGMFVTGGTSSVFLSADTVEGNQSIGGNSGGAGNGGQANGAFDFEAGTYKIVGSFVENNSATGGNSNTGTGGAAFGAGLVNANTASGTVLNSSFTSNTATGGNGATGGAAHGGGIDVFAGTLNLLNSTLGANTAQGGSAISAGGTRGAATGGGLSASGGVVTQALNNTIVFNQALSGSGGPVAAATPNGGGGDYGTAVTEPVFTNNIIQGNSSDGTGSDVNISGAAVPPTTIGNIIGGTLVVNTTSTVENGLTVYAVLPNAAHAIDGGSTSTVAAIAAAEGVAIANATDEVGALRTSANGTAIGFGAVQFNGTLVGVTFSNVPTSETISEGTTSTLSFVTTLKDLNGNTIVGAAAGPLAANTIVATVVDSSGNSVAGASSATVTVSASGTTTIPALTLPANLAAGTYSIQLQYTNSATGLSGTGSEPLTITPTVPTVPTTPTTPPPPSAIYSALEVAVDVAAIQLASNPAALMQLNLFSTLLLGHGVSSNPVGDALYYLNYADGLSTAAIQAGQSFAASLST